jgi:hypothetical protein
LKLDNSGIERYIEGMEKESRAIKDEAIRMMWWMRGGLSYEDALMLSITEKEIINELIKDNMKSTKDSGLPFF